MRYAGTKLASELNGQLPAKVCPDLSVVILMLCLLTGGCTVGPDYVRPEAALPDQWHEDLMDDFEGDRSNLNIWWTTLNDPVLDGLIKRARSGNLDLAATVERVFESRAFLAFATGDRYPQVDSIAAYERARVSEGIADFVAPPRSRTDNFYQFGFDSTWEIDLWGRITRSIESADADLGASVEDYRDVLVSLYAEVAATYIQVRTLQARIAAAENNAEAQAASVKLTKDRFEAEISPELDVRQAELNLAATRAVIPTLRSRLTRAINRLGVLLGQAPSAFQQELAKTAPIPQAQLDVSVGVPADLLRQRPDIRRAERQLAAQTARVGVAVADLYPQFSLTGFFAFEAVNSNRFFRSSSISYGYGPSYRWNIFDGNRIRSRVKIEESLTAQALINYEQTILFAMEEVENALTAYTQESQRRAELEKSVAAAEKSVELVKILYKTGLTNFQNVLDMQRSLFEQQDQLAESEGRIIVSLIGVYKAIGGGWDPQGNDLAANMEDSSDNEKGKLIK